MSSAQSKRRWRVTPWWGEDAGPSKIIEAVSADAAAEEYAREAQFTKPPYYEVRVVPGSADA